MNTVDFYLQVSIKNLHDSLKNLRVSIKNLYVSIKGAGITAFLQTVKYERFEEKILMDFISNLFGRDKNQSFLEASKQGQTENVEKLLRSNKLTLIIRMRTARLL